MQLFQKRSPLYYLGLFYIIISLITRGLFLLNPITQTSFTFFESLKIFVFGVFSDFFVFILISLLFILYLLFLSNSKFKRPWGYIYFGIYISVFFYILSGKSILNEYGGSLPEIGIVFIGIKTILFGLLLFLPKSRNRIRLVLFSVSLFLFVLLIVLNAVSEYFFWNEFGLRYNFIAVDYLIYTNTVIGNIIESYPVIPLFIGIGVVSLITTYVIVEKSKNYIKQLPKGIDKIKNFGLYILLFFISIWLLPSIAKLENSNNLFINELQSNGLYKFYIAFKNSELDYDKFYKKLSKKEVFALLKNQISGIESESSLRKIKSDSTEIHKNVVLITIESFSADFLKSYGDKQKITPFIDSLANQSLLFTNLYAVGNRTVRGLEAVTLCLPPTAGESVIKRLDNKNKFSTGNIFKLKGYSTKFLYGGDAYFDNMENFFSGNGYDIIDKKSLLDKEISFSNIWGVCDEDMAKKAISVMNQEAKTGKPFFNHWMTVSNHRPFTYPDGKIDIDAHSKSREGGIKYTDYALKQFFIMAEKQSWYKNTVFVILADHCASSSGKTELPLDKYRIPAMIYAPGFIEPKHYTNLMSQIDIMPTLFGILNFNYSSKFYGQDVLKSNYKPRALIATYQDLGLIKDQVLTIISPVKKVKQYHLTLKPKVGIKTDFQLYYEQNLLKNERKDLINETISYYQTASYLLKHKKYQK